MTLVLVCSGLAIVFAEDVPDVAKANAPIPSKRFTSITIKLYTDLVYFLLFRKQNHGRSCVLRMMLIIQIRSS